MLEFHQLRCFIAVAEELHFGRAARRLNLTQPPLSRQIKTLEAALGALLFVRTTRAVQLTPVGRVFLGEARQLLRRAEAAVNVARMVQRGHEGAISVGFTALAAVSLIPRLVSVSRARHPDIALVLREMLSTDQERWLLSGDLDLALLRPPIRPQELDSFIVHREHFVLAVPEGSALAQRTRLRSLGALHAEPFIMYSPEEARFFYDLVGGLFQEARVAPDIVQHAGTPYAILALVGARLGSALLPASVQAFPATGVRFLPITLPSRATIDFLAAWRRTNDNPALQAVVATLRSDIQANFVN